MLICKNYNGIEYDPITLANMTYFALCSNKFTSNTGLHVNGDRTLPCPSPHSLVHSSPAPCAVSTRPRWLSIFMVVEVLCQGVQLGA
jgi:hypothetical protein